MTCVCACYAYIRMYVRISTSQRILGQSLITHFDYCFNSVYGHLVVITGNNQVIVTRSHPISLITYVPLGLAIIF